MVLFKELANKIQEGSLVIMRTDTLYGILGRADVPSIVDQIYKAKGRDENKPFIILISNINELNRFGVQVTEELSEMLQKYWPGSITFILPVASECLEKFSYLHRGTNALAFRMPGKSELRELIAQTGPLVAPSANPQGFAPAKNIDEARDYFGDAINAYIDEGEVVDASASTIVRYDGTGFEVLRQGAVEFTK